MMHPLIIIVAGAMVALVLETFISQVMRYVRSR